MSIVDFASGKESQIFYVIIAYKRDADVYNNLKRLRKSVGVSVLYSTGLQIFCKKAPLCEGASNVVQVFAGEFFLHGKCHRALKFKRHLFLFQSYFDFNIVQRYSTNQLSCLHEFETSRRARMYVKKGTNYNAKYLLLI